MASVPDWQAVLAAEKKPRRLLRRLIRGVPIEPYLHWEALERLPPPSKFSSEQWWALLKLQRATRAQTLALPGESWSFVGTPTLGRLLDTLTTASPDSFREQGERFRISALTREAIHSCRLDGIQVQEDHPTKHAVRARHAPADPGLRAAWNLFHSLRRAEVEAPHRPLSATVLQEMAERLTDQTEDAGTWPGLRRTEDAERLAEFLEGRAEQDYVPPLVRATGVYAWLREALADWPAGGRFSRSFFNWSARRLGIAAGSATAWSKVLGRTPKKVRRALSQTVSDDHDLNYFLLPHLETLEVALEASERRIARKQLAESATPAFPAKGREPLNPRQQALLHRAWEHPETRFTIAAHQEAHGIVYETARTDLAALARRGIFVREKFNRAFVYRLAPPHRSRDR